MKDGAYWVMPGGDAAAEGSTALSIPQLGTPANEPMQGYAAGTAARSRLDAALAQTLDAHSELPLIVAGEAVRSGDLEAARVPHDHRHVLAEVHQARSEDVEGAIAAAREAWQDWHRTAWTERAAIFLRAAELAATEYRERLVAATMLDQSKTVAEAEADAACELADFFRFNVSNLRRLLEEQPASSTEAWNRMELRPLEGFVYAVTPFNFTAIGAHLPTAPALMGNTVVWKPSNHAMVGAALVLELLERAGLPPGVINLVYGDPSLVTKVALSSPHLAGIHFTGSSTVLRSLFAGVGANIERFRNFPRIVGEAGGKGFLLAHPSADPEGVVNALVHGAFGYQGQKCSAASRAYLPSSLWSAVGERLREEAAGIRVGDVTEPETAMGAVISEAALERHRAAIATVEQAADTRVIAGGRVDSEHGWFVHPTVVETTNPDLALLREELFGPVLGVYVYPDGGWDDVLALVDRTSPYALTGSLFAEDRAALLHGRDRLRFAAGNLYLNDKPTGAVVGQQPFGGSRGSGTNDKTGTTLHLARWVSALTIKQRHLPQRRTPLA